ncbi:L-alanine-DL-glutamate epimerase-like enolase superfamily enzyme [Friedmanniella endophytica]|uniref:L-alanine-DL-glutamate epimerase-like enolase superfamily enzyme n=1 Tax=Microlunatus kandeliicorticis TaxID=1759536 RepID=A0A7W3IUA1_9ACTN|nr:mandelate racemase/muconate lactonizing enzyme family protein [Microlunatus kandeliicorticis]MBA8795383.1 L-alanine-DL-glutamate epimerase-like enolase superfamily enzyme [Microlunatus kandeliicorticis]
MSVRPAVSITDVEAVHLRLPDVDAARCDGTQDTLLVFVTASDGTVGVGEADSSPPVAQAVVEAEPSHLIARGLRSVLLGRNPLDLELLWHNMVAGSRYFGGGSTMHAISAADIALWDLAGKLLGLPVAQLLGGPRSDRLDAYASLVMPDTPDLAAAAAAEYASRGYRAIKFGWGPLGADLALNEELVRRIRAAVGDEVAIMIDAGQVWDVKTAVRMAAVYEGYGVGWLEEPLPPDDVDGYRRLSDRTTLAIAGGEQESDYTAFEVLATRARLDVLQPDLGRCGGLTQGRRLAWLAARHHRRLVPHAFKSGVLVAASTHLAACAPTGGLIEHTVSTSPIARDLVRQEISFADGRVQLPLDRPGLGVEIDPTVLERLRVG